MDKQQVLDQSIQLDWANENYPDDRFPSFILKRCP